MSVAYALASMLPTWGPAAVLVGTFFEGETIVLLAGFAAGRGMMDAFAIALMAFLGTFCGDQLWFYLGRRHSDHRWIRRVAARPSLKRALGLIERHPALFILSARFFYGLRNVSPVAVGVSRIPAGRFLCLNAAAGLAWSVLFTALGYFSGGAIERVIAGFEGVGLYLLTGLALAVAAAALRWVVRRRPARPVAAQAGGAAPRAVAAPRALPAPDSNATFRRVP